MEKSKTTIPFFRSQCFAQRLGLSKLNPFPSDNQFYFTGLVISGGNGTDDNWPEVTNVQFNQTMSELSPGQTDSQVVASWKLGSTCDSVWPGLACTCVDLRWLAMTCDHFGRYQICTQVNASFLPFGHPTQVSSQVQLAAACDYLRVRLTRALWNCHLATEQRRCLLQTELTFSVSPLSLSLMCSPCSINIGGLQRDFVLS